MRSDSQAWQTLESAIEALANWNLLRGRPELPAVGEPGAEAPEHVHAAWAMLRQIPASDLLAATPTWSASEQLDRELGRFDARVLDILRRRVFADTPETLDELGANFRLTRERVRQLESRAIEALQTTQATAEVRALASHALGNARIVAPLETILGESPALVERVTKVSQPVWRVLDRLDPSFEVADGWWCRGTVKSVAAATRSALQTAAGDLRSFRVDELPMLRDFAWSADWIRYCGVQVHEGYALLASAGIPDRAAVTLEREGSPMSGEEIAARIGAERSVRSVKNALGSDERFVRVDRNSWALASWGLATYQSIRGLISDEVTANGGSIRLSKLVATITERFSVSATSVVGYASVPPFTTIDGIVEIASARRSAPRKSPYDTRRLFRLAEGWALRFTITADHARGSGSPLPSALIAVLGLSHGEARFMSCRLGDQRLGWSGPQATMGSIKRFVDADHLAIGDTCFAVFGTGGSFDIVPVQVEPDPGPLRAFALAGLTLGASPPTKAGLAHAVGLPAEVSHQQIAEKLRARGDYDIADCMLTGTWTST
ncbi:sigma factor-like helix-turn-helix DNA-binding protein [Microbacterium sp. SSM24]|uniref:sigma factor-like helix-turn-helix DNA-binding protein n=1 Tax=Microbacterium sp. SSM24 TaxID=2991714 RepID=UPI002226A407|nr:sigma factor-like helix-turn-helix DNA-binding protein [Microbacterium sp. SSM24]MCW3493894.1 hypothetical protein [Microbacterium sp. SSM24]